MKDKYPVLDKVDFPSDLKLLAPEELLVLSEEIRNYIIESVSITGGHLAAGLGTVELTIALHYIFDTPKDKIIWDVGHQCYPHKILTGRKNLMPTLRKKDGISGFLKRNESEYDCFGAGHSSTSISAAVGFEIASKLNNDDNKVIAVIGDGGLTAGMAYEALSHGGGIKSNLLVVLNDNEMSISPNVGAIHKYLTRILTGKTYSAIREGSKHVLSKIKAFETIAKKVGSKAKSFITPGLLFEELGFKYFGPVDGHDLGDLIEIFSNLKDRKGPRILHLMTRKGKGYKLAEKNPVSYHGVTPFNPITGKTKTNKLKNKLTYTQIFSRWLDEMARANEKLVVITPAMREGSGLVEFEKNFPDRYFDVGIAEQHALTLAGGLACNKIKPVVAIYSTFLQRAYDQLIHDVVIQELDVLLAIDRAGIVGADGETHQGIYDISFLRILPKMLIMTPSNEQELWKMLTTGFNYHGPSAVRYPRGYSLGMDLNLDLKEIKLGKAKVVRKGNSIAYLVFGTLLNTVHSVADELDATVIDMRFVKPLDINLIDEICLNHDYIITVEENVTLGGAGSAVNEAILNLYNQPKYNRAPKVFNLGIPDKTIMHGVQSELLADVGLDEEGIKRTTLNLVEENIIFKKN